MTVRIEIFAALVFGCLAACLSPAQAQVAAPEPPQVQPAENQTEQKPVDARTKAMVEAAQASMTAFDQKDFGKIIDSMHPRATKMMGGKEAALKLVERAMKSMGAQLENLKVTLGKPGSIVEADDFQFSYVLKNTKMFDDDGAELVNVDGYLLGISEDEGKTWTFLDSGAGAAKIRKMFPEVPETFKLPDES